MALNEVVRKLEMQALEMRKLLVNLSSHYGIHIGGDLSSTDLICALYLYKMKKDPGNPRWPGRDRFIISKGHAACCLYFAMAMAGYGSIEEIFASYGQTCSRYGMHPCCKQHPGMEVSSGSLGHALALGCGMALSAKMRAESHQVYVLLGDGELAEGSNWEGALNAAQHQLGNLTALVDRNRLSLLGYTEDDSQGMKLEPLTDKWRAFGWNVVTIHGNDMDSIVRALDALPPPTNDQPTVILAETQKGKGISFMEAHPENWHYGKLSQEQLAIALSDLREIERSLQGNENISSE